VLTGSPATKLSERAEAWRLRAGRSRLETPWPGRCGSGTSARKQASEGHAASSPVADRADSPARSGRLRCGRQHDLDRQPAWSAIPGQCRVDHRGSARLAHGAVQRLKGGHHLGRRAAVQRPAPATLAHPRIPDPGQRSGSARLRRRPDHRYRC
jgi:hypothetical protein